MLVYAFHSSNNISSLIVRRLLNFWRKIQTTFNQMASKNKTAGNRAMEFEIKFNGLMTVELRGKVLVEIIKSLIYQKGEIPLPFDQLKLYVESELAKPWHKPMPIEVFQDGACSATRNTDKSESLSVESNIPCADRQNIKIDVKFRKVRQAYDTLSILLDRLNVVIGNEIFNVEEVLLLTGATQITPRQLYRFFLPNLNEKICEKHELPKLTLKSCMVRIFREVIANNIFWESCVNAGNVNSPTNIIVLVKMDRSVTMSDHMEPQINFKIPTKAAKSVHMPISLKCAECEKNLNETEALNQSMRKISLNEYLETDSIWVKILPIAKGFSNSLLDIP